MKEQLQQICEESLLSEFCSLDHHERTRCHGRQHASDCEPDASADVGQPEWVFDVGLSVTSAESQLITHRNRSRDDDVRVDAQVQSQTVVVRRLTAMFLDEPQSLDVPDP